MGENWFFPENKTLTVSLLHLENQNPVPELYSHDMNNNVMKRIFPDPINESHNTLLQELSVLRFDQIDRPTLFFDPQKEEYIYTFSASLTSVPAIVSFNVKA